jgi:hypothetical protein
MDSGSTQPTGSAASSVPKNPAMTSCRKKKSEEATFIEDVRDHIDEFIHASMDEHKTCFKKTIQKVSCTTTLKIVFSFSRFCCEAIHLVLNSSVSHVLCRCLACQRLLRSDPQKRRELKLKVHCRFRLVFHSRMQWCQV